MAKPARKGEVRAGIAAATEAIELRDAAQVLHERGGRRVLPPELRSVVRDGIETRAEGFLKRCGIVSIDGPVHRAEKGSVVKESGKAAAREVASGVGRAARTGALIDAAVGAVEAAVAFHEGDMSGKEAVAHIAKEGASGAVASATGTALAAGVVVLVGPVAPAAVAAISIAGSLAAKAGLRRLWE